MASNKALDKRQALYTFFFSTDQGMNVLIDLGKMLGINKSPIVPNDQLSTGRMIGRQDAFREILALAEVSEIEILNKLKTELLRSKENGRS